MPLKPCLKTAFTVLLAVQTSLAFTHSAWSAEEVETGTKSDTSKSAANIQERYPVGLDKKTLKLINQGHWKEAADRLEKLTANDDSFSRNNVWLAFAYMFLNRSKDLDELQKRLVAGEDRHEKTYKKVVDAFFKISKGETKEAANILKTLPKEHTNDALVNFALAAVSGKNGKAGAAIEYSRRSVEIDPTFAWGFRTLGYLESRWMNRQKEAEEHLNEALKIEPDQDEVRNMLVRIKLARNDFDGALEVARGDIKIDKKDPGNHLSLASILERQWRFNEALEELNKAIKLNPDKAVYFRRRASIRKQQGDLKAAIKDQTKAVALSKSQTFELIELANLNVEDNNVDAAIANLKEALESDPKNKKAHEELTEILHANKKWDELVSELRRAIEQNEKDSELHYDLGMALMKVKNSKEALAEFTTASNLNEKDPKPLRQIGTYYAEEKVYDKAIKAFKKALNINPTSTKDMVALGYCFAQDDNYLQSEAAFVTALALKQLTKEPDDVPPSRADIIRTLASLLLLEGRYADARNQFESLYSMTRNTKAKDIDWFLLHQAEALSGRSDKEFNKMIEAYGKLNEKNQKDYRYSYIQALIKLEKGEEALKALSKIDGAEFVKEPKWKILKARALREAGELDQAKELIGAALEIARKREELEPSLVADALVEKARIELALGDMDASEKSATSALETYTKAFASYMVLGKIKFKQEKFRESIDLLAKALEQNPYIAEAYLMTGDSYMALDDAKLALESYKKAAEIYPGYVKTHQSLAKAYKKLGDEDSLAKEEEQIKNMLK